MTRSPDSVVTFSLARDRATSTLDDRVIGELHELLDLTERDPNLKVMIIEGNPDDFCTGMDLGGAAAESAAEIEQGAARFYDLLTRLRCSPAAVVAAVAGQTAGGGVGLAASADIVIAGSAATFRLPELSWGIVPSCVFGPIADRIGVHHTNRLALTADRIDVAAAHRLGLVDVHATDLERAVRRTAGRIATFDREAIAGLKQLARHVAHSGPEQLRPFALEQLGRLASQAHVQARFASHASSMADRRAVGTP